MNAARLNSVFTLEIRQTLLCLLIRSIIMVYYSKASPCFSKTDYFTLHTVIFLHWSIPVLLYCSYVVTVTTELALYIEAKFLTKVVLNFVNMVGNLDNLLI